METVTERVSRITEFRQRQFQKKRDQIRQAMEERESSRLAEEAALKAKEAEEAAAQEEAKAKEAVDSDRKESQEGDVKSRGLVNVAELEANSEEGVPEAMKTISSNRKLLSEYHH